jgi:hypothetical protein
MKDLIAFLETLVLSTGLVDKKYRDALPDVVSTIVMGDVSADEADKAKPKSTRQKIKKMKPGKNGLYHTEDGYIRQWWGLHDATVESNVPGESREDVIRKRVSNLRIRETQLQMIVILETLALQPLATPQIDHHDELPTMNQKDGAIESKTLSRSRSKKPMDLGVLLEVHVDRLCIWQSVAAEEGIAGSKTEEGAKVNPSSGNSGNTHGHAADTLRDFCTEVIVPL